MRLRAGLAIVALASILASCVHGGTGSSTLPGTRGSSGGTRAAHAAGPTGTLYVSSRLAVYAYPLNADGPTTPLRTITPHANQTIYNAGVAVLADGNLGVVQNYFPAGGGSHCRIVVLDSAASGTNGALRNVDCVAKADQSTGYGIAANLNLPVPSPTPSASPGPPQAPTGDAFDVLVTDTTAAIQSIQRFDEYGNVLSSLPFSTPQRTLATDKGGHDYVDDVSGFVRKYQRTATTEAQSVAMFGAGPTPGPMAVSPVDLTLYVATTDNGGNPIINQYTNNGPGNNYTLNQTLSPFPHYTIGALAVDALGELYVGLYQTTSGNGAAASNVIRVYNLQGDTPTVVRVIPNPVPGNPNAITGLAIAQAPFRPTPVPSPTPVPTPTPTATPTPSPTPTIIIVPAPPRPPN